MSDREQLIQKLREEIDRCKLGKLDSQKESDMGLLPLAALNTRLSEYDRRIAEARAELSELLTVADAASHEAASGEDTPQQWDVFLSYQRDSEAEAREVHRKLTDAGLRVWQDVHNIPHTARWNENVDVALRQSKRLLLLMDTKSHGFARSRQRMVLFLYEGKTAALSAVGNLQHSASTSAISIPRLA